MLASLQKHCPPTPTANSLHVKGARQVADTQPHTDAVFALLTESQPPLSNVFLLSILVANYAL